jgi:hypothetical protein
MFTLVWLVCAATVTAQTGKVDAVALAKATLERLTKGDYAAVVASFDDKVRALMPEDKLKATWESVQSQFGAVARTWDASLTAKGDYQVVVIPTEFARAKLEFQIAVDASGRIAGLNIRPAAAPSSAFTDAPYVTPANFTERDVTIDAGGWPLPGTVTMPTGQGPFPAVVLVHGSGPQDRDLTIGPNKPFRDLARGLASRGIAALRYEKRTRVHGSKLAGLPAFTVKEETIDDAVEAVEQLRKTAGIDPARVFVIGHSLGGMVAPRIATAAGNSLAGLVIMAGAVRSLEQSLVDQSMYLARADGTVTPDEEKRLEELETFVNAIRALKPGDQAPAMPGLNAPASYWLDLRGYHPPDAARTVKAPMLIL